MNEKNHIYKLKLIGFLEKSNLVHFTSAVFRRCKSTILKIGIKDFERMQPLLSDHYNWV